MNAIPSTPQRVPLLHDLPSPPLSSSPDSVSAFADPPCGKAPALPCVRASGASVAAVDAEAALRKSIDGISELRILDSTDAAHVAQGAKDGRALAAGGRQLQIRVVADSFRGAKPLARHRKVMGALKHLIDSGAIHSVQVKAVPTPVQVVG
mmetsp:Transcript_5124/g.16194  ORF Transcript_5124/g.16194 Transcript_5124/m.16194 type:complete len:151 (+) Transcript_5124:178-630(+)